MQMQRNRLLNKARDNRGSALVEFAVAFPVLLLLCLGATDFGRLFFHGVTISNAAASGAFFGAQSNVASAQNGMMQRVATDDADDVDHLSGVSATASRFCECPGAPPTPISCAQAANTAACSGYGAPRAYVQVDVQQTFQTIAPYPGIPSGTLVGRNAAMRVQ